MVFNHHGDRYVKTLVKKVGFHQKSGFSKGVSPKKNGMQPIDADTHLTSGGQQQQTRNELGIQLTANRTDDISSKTRKHGAQTVCLKMAKEWSGSQ